MNTKYFDLINQTYYFPQEEFTLNKENALQFHNIDLMKLVEQYGIAELADYTCRITLKEHNETALRLRASLMASDLFDIE